MGHTIVKRTSASVYKEYSEYTILQKVHKNDNGRFEIMNICKVYEPEYQYIMLKCDKCNCLNENEEDNNYCRRCGNPLHIEDFSSVMDYLRVRKGINI